MDTKSVYFSWEVMPSPAMFGEHLGTFPDVFVETRARYCSQKVRQSLAAFMGTKSGVFWVFFFRKPGDISSRVCGDQIQIFLLEVGPSPATFGVVKTIYF